MINKFTTKGSLCLFMHQHKLHRMFISALTKTQENSTLATEKEMYQ